jgi:hypothetical protein
VVKTFLYTVTFAITLSETGPAQTNTRSILHLSSDSLTHVSSGQRQATPDSGSVAFQYKTRSTAIALSVLMPGAGQIYAGETRRGLVMGGIGLTGTAVILSSLSTSKASCYVHYCSSLIGPLTAGYLLNLGAWVYSVVDAPRAVARHNSLARATATALIEPFVGRTADGASNFGIRLEF